MLRKPPYSRLVRHTLLGCAFMLPPTQQCDRKSVNGYA